jgi:excinuclease ABC subunit C
MRLLPGDKTNYPLNPGVYRMLDKDEKIIYIGKAKNLKNRLTTYFDNSDKSPRIKLMVSEVKGIEVTVTASENDALVLEQKLINKIKPRYNIIFRDDKSYPFIALSKHAFPKIQIQREKNSNLKKENLFGPYPRAEEAYQNVAFIQNIFKIRTCTDNEFAHRSRPCMLHGIGKCSAPCVNQNDKEFIMHYQEDVFNAKNLLAGHVKPAIKNLEEKMGQAAMALRFEEAARLRDTIEALKNLSNHQTIFSLKEENVWVFNYYQDTQRDILFLGFSSIIDGVPQNLEYQEITDELQDYSLEELLTSYIESKISEGFVPKIITPFALDDFFHHYQYTHFNVTQKGWLKLVAHNLEMTANEIIRKRTHQQQIVDSLQEVFIHEIHSIDCIDISHHAGEATYGGKVRWASFNGAQGEMDKSYYRLAKFEDRLIDDILHMEQTVERIYHEDTDFPDILLIDGDLPQLEAAYKALSQKPLSKPYVLMSSAKGVSRKKGAEIFYIHPVSYELISPRFLDGNILAVSKQHPVRLLFQKLQDGAHDFSNSARRKKMEKERFN